MKTYCLTLDLKDDPQLITEYEAHHKAVWPEVQESIYKSGIVHIQIYRCHTRLVMMLQTKDDFSFETKAEMDAANPKVQEWEQLMWKFQQPLDNAKPGQKWVLMDQIFEA
uniref:L-rhamnose mutarotase n=1 Tax=Ditylenchus dipsaci TaxID=166011 RepID=A0A915ES73_9BILA